MFLLLGTNTSDSKNQNEELIQHKDFISTKEMEYLEVSMRGKFRLSESTRPDILQLFQGFSSAFRNLGLDYDATIIGKVQDFNQKAQVSSARISEQELMLLVKLPHQSSEFLDSLSKHWDNFKSPQSGVTLKSLCNSLDRKCPAVESAEWKDVLSPSASKNLMWLRRQITIFDKNFKQAQSNSKKAVNLAFGAVSCLGEVCF